MQSNWDDINFIANFIDFDDSWESSNGIKQEESGHVVNEGSKDESIAVRGIFQWTDQNGETYSVSYIADDNGFQPEGAHLPKAEQ